MPRWVVGMLLACALLSSLVVAAAGDDPVLPDAPSRAYSLNALEVLPNLVTVRDVLGTREGSPERSILSSFQAVQFKDLGMLRSLLTEPFRSPDVRARIADAVRLVGAALGRPVPSGTRIDGGRAEVRVIVLAYPGAERRPTQAQTYTLSLRRVSGRWLLDDLEFLLEPAAELEAARARRP